MGAASRKRWDREHSKATLARTAEQLFAERQVFRVTERARWRRRFILATIGSFVAGWLSAIATYRLMVA